MSGLDPLKSAICYENRDDTSLALPSVNQYRSGEQRVKEQVQTIKRTKSKHFSTKSGSTSMSPTSPSFDLNGSVFTNGFSRSFSLEKNLNNHQTFDNSKRQTTRKSATYSGFRYESGHGLYGSTAAGQTDTSRSEPALALQYTATKSSVPPQRMFSKKSTYVKSRSSQYGKRHPSQSHQKNVPNGQVKTQYLAGAPSSPVQLKPQYSMTVANGSGQMKSQYHTGVPNGLGQVKAPYPAVVPKSPGLIKPQKSMFVSNGTGQMKSQYLAGAPSSPVQLKPQYSMTVANGSGQMKSQYHAVVPNGPGPVKAPYPAVVPKSPGLLKPQKSMFVSNVSSQMKSQYHTVSNSSGQVKSQYQTGVPNGLGQVKAPYPAVVPKSPGLIKSQKSMFVSNSPSQIKAQSSQSGMIKTSSATVVTDGSTKTKEMSGLNETTAVADITLKDAVDFLSKDDENYQYCGASYIQHNTFISDNAKEEVLKLKGIPPLVNLLRSPSTQVRYTASAALRNLSYKSDSNKREIHRCSGIPAAVTQLKDSDSVELNKQLTGLLWNLSSAENLKSDLMKEALPVLTEHVIQPYTNQTTKTERDPEVFFHATGCIRNLSSAKLESRRALRKQRSLIDSLVTYVKECVDKGQDDESLDNCLCILHNLSFKLDSEAPDLFYNINSLASTKIRSQSHNNVSTVGCFSSPSKSYESHFDYPVIEEQKPRGASLLFHSSTLQSYLSLLGPTQRDETRETCCKILQNLTSNNNISSSVISQVIVQKLNGMQFISPLLTSDKINLQTSAMGLVGNLIKNPNLHTAIGNKALPGLMTVLKNGTDGANESDDSFAMACQSASALLLKEPEFTKKYLNLQLIDSLKDVSRNKYFPKSSKAASILLLNMWSDKELQSYLRKEGMSKSMFVNEVTMAAQKSVQGIY